MPLEINPAGNTNNAQIDALNPLRSIFNQIRNNPEALTALRSVINSRNTEAFNTSFQTFTTILNRTNPRLVQNNPNLREGLRGLMEVNRFLSDLAIGSR